MEPRRRRGDPGQGVPEESRDHHVRQEQPERSSTSLFVVISTFLLIVGVAAVGYGYIVVGHGKKVAGGKAQARTQCGIVNGVMEEGVYVFRRIPYAKPPMGIYRWKPPQELTADSGCWKGELPASELGTLCLQDYPGPTLAFAGGEDCLHLAVWTPTVDPKANLPVIVYVHGGHFRYSSGSLPGFAPSSPLAKQMNVVFVGLNYRLFTLGFLSLDMLANANGKSGNYGLLDQIAGLKWVQKNIRNFGGNPNKVTLLGHGSGATSIMGLLFSPSAKGLFHGAWASSPGAFLNTTYSEASKLNAAMLKHVNCNSIDCMQAAAAESLLTMGYNYWTTKEKASLPTKFKFDPSVVIVDGEVIPFSTTDALVKKTYNDVPLVLGSVAQEASPGIPDQVPDYKTLRPKLVEHLDPFKPGISDIAWKMYNDSAMLGGYKPTTASIYITMVSDIRSVCSVGHLSSLLDSHFRSPVYRYVATARPSVPVHLPWEVKSSQFSFHLWDALAMFDVIKIFVGHRTKEDLSFQKHLISNLQDFVRTGRISQPGWTMVPTVAEISGKVQITDGYHTKACQMWAEAGFLPYSWKY